MNGRRERETETEEQCGRKEGAVRVVGGLQDEV